MGALTVTNAVGALNTINGIAGSFAEHVPSSASPGRYRCGRSKLDPGGR
jgi:TPP-dependent 2-oxoacid decarboxylase